MTEMKMIQSKSDVAHVTFNVINDAKGQPDSVLEQLILNVPTYAPKDHNVIIKINRYLRQEDNVVMASIIQNYSMNKEQRTAFFEWVWGTTADKNDINGRGEGRLNTISASVDKMIHVLISNEGNLFYGVVGALLYNSDEGRAVIGHMTSEINPDFKYPDYMEDVVENMDDNSTAFVINFPDSQDGTISKVDKWVAEQTEFLLESKKVKMYGIDGNLIKTNRQRNNTPELKVPPNLYKRLREWKEEVITGAARTQTIIKAADSEPEIKITKEAGLINKIKLSAAGFAISPLYQTDLRATHCAINWDFLITFVNAQKKLNTSQQIIRQFVRIVDEEVNKEYAVTESTTIDSEIVKEAQDWINQISKEIGPADPPQSERKFRWKCKNCGHRQFFMLRVNPNISSPSSEEKSMMVCEVCGCTNFEYDPENPEPPKELKCPKCANTDIDTIINKENTEVLHHCNICGFDWSNPTRPPKRYGILIREIESDKFIRFNIEERSIEIGNRSVVFNKYVKGADKDQKKAILLQYFTRFVGYLKEEVKTDNEYRSWRLQEMAFESYERNLIKTR